MALELVFRVQFKWNRNFFFAPTFIFISKLLWKWSFGCNFCDYSESSLTLCTKIFLCRLVSHLDLDSCVSTFVRKRHFHSEWNFDRASYVIGMIKCKFFNPLRYCCGASRSLRKQKHVQVTTHNNNTKMIQLWVVVQRAEEFRNETKWWTTWKYNFFSSI